MSTKDKRPLSRLLGRDREQRDLCRDAMLLQNKKNAFKGIDERLPIKWMPPRWKIWNQTSGRFLPVSDATLQFWLVAMLAPLGRGQDRISQGTFSSWIRVFRACRVGWRPGKEHLMPSLEIGLFCQDVPEAC